MSCILYTPNDYRALARSAAFYGVWRDCLEHSYARPMDAARALWRLNRRAYQDRYDMLVVWRWDDAPAETDAHFARLAATTAAPLCWAYLWEVLAGIRYQCVDAENFQDLAAFGDLEAAMHAAAQRMASHFTGR